MAHSFSVFILSSLTLHFVDCVVLCLKMAIVHSALRPNVHAKISLICGVFSALLMEFRKEEETISQQKTFLLIPFHSFLSTYS